MSKNEILIPTHSEISVPFNNPDIKEYLRSRAYSVVREYHSGQKRKYTGEEYRHHLVRVGNALAKKYPEDFALEIAGYLHDTLEDTKYTFEEMVETFGLDVAWLVSQVTTPKEFDVLKREEKHQRECKRLSHISTRAKRLKRADISDNLSDIALHNPNYATLYIQEKVDQLKAMGYHHDKKKRQTSKESQNSTETTGDNEERRLSQGQEKGASNPSEEQA